MLCNYFVVALRNILKDKFYSLINVFGLALGTASCIFILIYITDELSFDQFHEKADRTYRVIEFIEPEGSPGEQSSSAPFAVGPNLANEYPAIIESQVRFFNFQSPTLLISEQESKKEFNEPEVLFVDSTFFDVFDYKVIKGNRETALDQPNSVLITESVARKYFGDQDPMGKFLRVQDRQELLITGIMPDTPENAHFDFDFLISFSTLRAFFPTNPNGQSALNSWYWNPCWTYVVLKEGVNSEELENEFSAFVDKFFTPEFVKEDARLALQPLTDIHLTSHLEFEMKANSSEDNIYVFILIGVVILFIASMNFMNLSTARSAKRAKEVGLRKTLGSAKSQLILQFLLESFIISFLAIILAVILTVVGLPWFNIIAGKAIGYGVLVSTTILGSLAAILLVVGFGSGLYPALVLSSFVPVKVLKDSQDKGGRGAFLRKMLVVIQFSLSIIMIIGTVIAINQLDFLRQSDTGFDKDQILYVSALRTPITQSYPAFKKELENQAEIERVTGVLDVLGAHHQGDNFRFEGMDNLNLYSVFWVNHDFFKTFDLEILEGRAFKKNITTDDSLALIVNEALVKGQGWEMEESIGKPFTYGQYTGEIVGVEALIRWQHPLRGLLTPIDFLPITEDHAISIEIGEWVIDTALKQISHWQKIGFTLPISINISAYQLQQSNFVTRFTTLLAAHKDVSPNDLELEVLETSVLDDVHHVSTIMNACIALGTNFSLDDFGTGYSSLTHLRRLPANLIKIDQTFVRDMSHDADDLAIVKGVIALAKSFKRDVIAEGVETIDHGNTLLQLGCDLAQGYGIARPMPASDIPTWINDWKPDVSWQI
jgi:putative ABC transport system permease protein